MVTINPSADLADGDVYVEVGSGFYDTDGNQGSSVNATFTVDTVVPTISTAAVIGNTLTATFSENLDTSKKAAKSPFTVDVAGTNDDPTVSSYTLSGKTATMTLSKAVKQGETLTLRYTQPAGNAAKIADLAGNALASTPSGSEVSVTNNTDDTTPTVAFKLGEVALTGTVLSNDADGNIVLTFSEPVYADNTATAFTDSTVDDVITLTEDDADGDAIGFAVSVTTSGANANKVVTINPTNDLEDGVVYVAVSNAFYDAQGNQGAATNATFTVDTVVPTISTAAVNGTALTVVFSENMKTTPLPAATAFVLAVDAGTAPTASSISITGKTATVTLATAVLETQTVTLRYVKPGANPLKDLAGNDLVTTPSNMPVSVTNNTDDTAPSVTFSPANGARTNAKSADITLTFDEAVYKDASQGEFGASDLESLIELKVTNDNGNTIGFSASINDANTVVTINPSSDLSDGDVYVELGSGFYDADGNQGSTVNATFTVDTVVPTISTASVNGTALTVVFSEDVKTTPLPAATAFVLAVDAGTAPTASSVSITGKTATVTLGTAVLETQTVTLRYVKPGANPLKDLAGNELVTIPDTEAARVSVTNNTDDTAPTVAFSPVNGARTKAKSADITLTFNEAVYKDANGAEFGASDLESLIELKVTDDNGNTIGFSASINDANTVVTVNPSADLADGDVYVEVGSGFYDEDGNQGSETSTTFTVDTVVPTRASLTVDRTALVVTFNENLDTSSTPAASSFSVNGGQGPTVSSVSLSGKAATLTLATAVSQGATVTLSFTQPSTNKLKDVAGNEAAGFSGVSVTNNTDTTAPSVTFSPANSARTNAKSSDLTLTFNEAVYKDANGAEFGASDLESLIELKVTDDNGNTIGFSASINDANTIVTVNPSSDLADGDVYVEVGSGFYDADGNQVSSTNATFTVDTVVPTISTAAVKGTALTVTFSEDVRTTPLPAATAFVLAVDAGTAPTASSVSITGKTATVTLGTAVTETQTVTLRYVKPGANPLQDLAGNDLATTAQNTPVSVTNNTDDTAPSVTFSPLERRAHQRQVRRHHPDLRRGGVQGRERRRVRGERPGIADRVEGDGRQRLDDQLLGEHQRRQHRGDHQSVVQTCRTVTCTWRSAAASTTPTATRAAR